MEYVVAGLLWIAGTFTLIASVGVLRFPDVYLRMHAATKAGTIGVISSLLALTLYFDDPAIRVRALLVALFLCITAPIVAHVLSRASLIAHVPLDSRTITNEWEPESMGAQAGPANEDEEKHG